MNNNNAGGVKSKIICYFDYINYLQGANEFFYTILLDHCFNSGMHFY